MVILLTRTSFSAFSVHNSASLKTQLAKSVSAVESQDLVWQLMFNHTAYSAVCPKVQVIEHHTAVFKMLFLFNDFLQLLTPQCPLNSYKLSLDVPKDDIVTYPSCCDTRDHYK